jgi:hypothetical protein
VPGTFYEMKRTRPLQHSAYKSTQLAVTSAPSTQRSSPGRQ